MSERSPVYSGMMSYEKAARELPFLGFMFEMPIVVAGVGVRGVEYTVTGTRPRNSGQITLTG